MNDNTKPAGRPRLGINLNRVNLSLDDFTIDKARALGRGNVSRGVREAVELAFAAAEREKSAERG